MYPIHSFSKNAVNNSNNSCTYKEDNIICWPNATVVHASWRPKKSL